MALSTQGDPNLNFQIQIAISLKIEANIYIHFSAVCLQFGCTYQHGSEVYIFRVIFSH